VPLDYLLCFDKYPSEALYLITQESFNFILTLLFVGFGQDHFGQIISLTFGEVLLEASIRFYYDK